MRKKWTILFLCAFMAIAAFGSAAAFSFRQADAETGNETGSAPVLSIKEENAKQIADKGWIYGVTIETEGPVRVGDVLTIHYALDDDPKGSVTPQIWVGDAEASGNSFTAQEGDWSHTLTAGGTDVDIVFGIWSKSFKVTSATLQQKISYDQDLFVPTEDVSESQQYTTGDIAGSIKASATLSGGQIPDKTSYYLSATGASGSIVRLDQSENMDLYQAYLDGAELEFSAKFDFAAEGGRTAELRLFSSYNNTDDRNFSVTRLDALEEFVAGQWVTYSLPLSSLSQVLVDRTWTGGPVGTYFDWTRFRGIGFSFGSDGASNAVSFGEVRIKGINKSEKMNGITAEGAKTAYDAGQSFDATGLKVYATYSDGTKTAIYDYKVTASDPLTVSDKQVTISWKTFQTEIDITVSSIYKALKIVTPPGKLTYKAGEVFDPAGISLQAVLKADDSTEDLELSDVSYTYKDELLQEGVDAIVFSYSGCSVTQPIEVSDFEYSEVLFGSVSLDNDGDPADGWNFGIAGDNGIASEETFNAASDTSKLRKIGVDPVEGMYITAEASYSFSRVFEKEVAEFNIAEAYTNSDDYLTVVEIRYRADSKSGDFMFGLGNEDNYNLEFYAIDIKSYVIADGKWHTMYIDVDSLYGAINNALWGTPEGGNVDFTKIAGFALKCTSDDLDIASVKIKWHGNADAVTRVDTYSPKVEYYGDMSLDLTAGAAAPTFEDATAFDNYDGLLSVLVKWSDGAVTDGKLNKGTHTATLYAEDQAGNKSDNNNTYVITVNVTEENTGTQQPGGNEEGTQQPGGSDGTENTPPDDGGKGKGKGCGGTVAGSFGALAVLIMGSAVVLSVRRKKKQ